MNSLKVSLMLSVCIVCVTACNTTTPKTPVPNYPQGSFGYDLSFLKEHTDVLVLMSDDSSAQVAIVPSYQGRIMTSTMKGLGGKSLGWLNYNLISSKSYNPHIHAFGGEDRFWLGPEGGQYSIFFPPEAEFTFENWQTPGAIDTAIYPVVQESAKSVLFRKQIQLQNYSKTIFDLEVNRKIGLLTLEEIEAELEIILSEEIDFVAFQSENSITNIGKNPWKKDNGLLSIWILGMFPPSPNTTIIIPTNYVVNLSKYINDEYFGKVPLERLIISDSVVYFKGDGIYRSKIGISPAVALPILGSYNSEDQILTIVKFTLEPNEPYVNSLWMMQDKPYEGDAVNSYNDGPLENSTDQLGPFYELESSSPAKELDSGQSLLHVHQTFHFGGSEEELNKIAEQVLSVALDSVANIFSSTY